MFRKSSYNKHNNGQDYSMKLFTTDCKMNTVKKVAKKKSMTSMKTVYTNKFNNINFIIVLKSYILLTMLKHCALLISIVCDLMLQQCFRCTVFSFSFSFQPPFGTSSISLEPSIKR